MHKLDQSVWQLVSGLCPHPPGESTRGKEKEGLTEGERGGLSLGPPRFMLSFLGVHWSCYVLLFTYFANCWTLVCHPQWSRLSRVCAGCFHTVCSISRPYIPWIGSCVPAVRKLVTERFDSLPVIHRESKKGRHYTLVHIFAKYCPIFIILSPTYSVGNWQ